MVIGRIINDALSKIDVYPCEIFGLRIKADSLTCVR